MSSLNKIEQLEFRKLKFFEFTDKFTIKGEHIANGLFLIDLPKPLFENILTSCVQFISKVCTHRNDLLDMSDIQYFMDPKIFQSLENITPSGMILPKRSSSFEYNHLMKNFYGITNFLKMPVDSWYSILPLRYKASYREDYKAGIQYSHQVHLDSWTGFSNYAYAAFMPLLGDIENNYIEYWEPIAGIEESWISGNKTSDERAEILKNFKKIDFKLKFGQLAIADSYGAHNTMILRDAKPRISIDNLFIPSWAKNLQHTQSPYRNSDLISNEVLTKIGENYYFDFYDEDSTRRPSMGGLKSPIGYNLIKIRN